MSEGHELLAFAARYTVLRGAIGMPYESHDIGGDNYPKNGNRPPNTSANTVSTRLATSS